MSPAVALSQLHRRIQSEDLSCASACSGIPYTFRHLTSHGFRGKTNTMGGKFTGLTSNNVVFFVSIMCVLITVLKKHMKHALFVKNRRGSEALHSRQGNPS
jgi:hypothetical protein